MKYAMQAIQLYNMAEQFIEHKNGQELREKQKRLDEMRLRHDIAAEPEKQALERQANELKRRRDAFALFMEPARQVAKIADYQEKEEERDANRALRREQLAGDIAEERKRNLDAKRQYVEDVGNTVGDGEEKAKAAIAAYRDSLQAYHNVITSHNGDLKTLLGIAASPGSDDGTVTQNSMNSALANADRYGMSKTGKQYMIETVAETQILASTGEETSQKIFAGQNDPERMARAYVYGDSELPEEDELSAIPTDQYNDLVSGMAANAITRYQDMSGARGSTAMKKQVAFASAMQAVNQKENPVRYEVGKEVAKRLGNFISSDRQTALAKYDADYEQEQAADFLDVAEGSLLDFANLPGKTIFDLATAERIDRERLMQRVGAGGPVEDKEVAVSVLEVGGDALRKQVLAGKGASGEAIALAQSAIIEEMKDRVLASKVSPAKTERAYSALSRASKIVEAGGSIGGALGTLLEVSTEKYLKYLPVEMERQSAITKKERTLSTLNREYHNAETVYPVDGGEPILVSRDTGENGRAYVQLLAGQPSKLYGNVTYRVFGEEAIPGLENRIDLVVKGEGVVPIHSSRFVEDPANLVTMGYAPSFHVGAASKALDEYAKKDGTETAKPQLVLKDGHWTIGPVRSGITWRPHKSARVTNQQKAAVQSIQYGAVESILSQGPSLTRLLEGFGPNVLLSDAEDKDFIFSDTDNIVVESPLYRAINTSGLEEELVAGLNLLLFDGYDVLMENVTPVEAKLAVAKKYQEIAVEALGDFVGASVDPAHQQELIARGTGFYEDEVSATGQRNFILITRGMNRLGINPLGSMGGVQYKVPGPSDVYTPKDRGPGL